MRAAVCLAFLLLAGCLDEPGSPRIPPGTSAGEGGSPSMEVDAERADAPLAYPRPLGTFEARLLVGACPARPPDPVGCRAAGVMTTQPAFRVDASERDAAMRRGGEWVVVASWNATQATADALGIEIGTNGGVLASASGVSPLEVRIPADALAADTAYFLDVFPTKGVAYEPSVSFSLDLRDAP